MAYSTDAEILRVIGELSDIHDHDELDNAALSFVRVKACITRSIAELNSIHERSGEATHTVEFRSALPSVHIALGYFWGAIQSSESNEGESTVINNLWVALSYLEAGLVLLLAATQENDGNPLNG